MRLRSRIRSIRITGARTSEQRTGRVDRWRDAWCDGAMVAAARCRGVRRRVSLLGAFGGLGFAFSGARATRWQLSDVLSPWACMPRAETFQRSVD